MLGLTVKDSKEKIVFTIDKSSFTEATWIKMMQIARAECLIREAAFDKSIVALGEELKEGWWLENKPEFLKDLHL